MSKEVRLQFLPSQPHHLLQLGQGGEIVKSGETFEVSEKDAEELLTNPGTADDIRRSGSSVDPHRKAEETDTTVGGGVTDAGAKVIEGDSAPQSPPSGTAT